MKWPLDEITIVLNNIKMQWPFQMTIVEMTFDW
jgi:hypothetical protein